MNTAFNRVLKHAARLNTPRLVAAGIAQVPPAEVFAIEQRLETFFGSRQSQRKSQELYSLMRLMCDNVPDMIWAKDLNGAFTFVNRAMAAKVLGAADTEEPIGKAIQIDAMFYTVIGVAPRGFTGLWPGQPPAAYIPITTYGGELAANFRLRGETWWTTYHWTWASMLVQRKPGVSLEAANADLTTAYLKSYRTQDAADHGGMTPIAVARPHAIAASVLSERGPN